MHKFKVGDLVRPNNTASSSDIKYAFKGNRELPARILGIVDKVASFKCRCEPGYEEIWSIPINRLVPYYRSVSDVLHGFLMGNEICPEDLKRILDLRK